MRIMLVISSLGTGGAERVLSEMANYWVAQGHSITLVTLDSTQSDFYSLSPRIQRFALGLKGDSGSLWRAITSNIKRVLSLRDVFKRSAPQAIISFVDTVNILTILSGIGLGIPLIVSERTDPRHHHLGRQWRSLRRMLYPKASAVVVQTPGVCEWMQNVMPNTRIVTIPNPARIAVSQNKESFVFSSAHNIVAVGRLSHEKGFDILIKAFAHGAKAFPEWNLTIFGDGAARPSLEKLVTQLALGDRISLPGIIKEPMEALSSADIFVLSSRYEGFPNSLVEAMVCGLPVIASDCQSGPRELIDNGFNGILVNPANIREMAKALRSLMLNESLRRTLGMKAREVKSRFDSAIVLGLWEDLLNRVIKNSRR